MDLNELAAKYGGKPIEKEQSNDLAAQFGGKPVEKTVNLAEQFGGVPIKKVEPEPTPETEKFSTLRQIADVPLQLGKGAVTGVRMIADAFGAGSDISKTLKGGEDYLAGLMSAQSKQDSKEISRIMKEAEDKGILDQVVAGVKALSVAPVDTLVNAFGTAAPAIVGGLAATVGSAPVLVGTAVSAGIGAAMGAGTIKGTIYDAVKEELSKTDMPKEQIEARAQLAQNYNGKNLDMILTGAAIGTLGATTGIEPALAKTFSKGILDKATKEEAKNITKEEAKLLAKKEAAQIAKEKAEEETKKIAAQGIKKYAVKEGATEFATEFSQAAQEQFSENLALQREGYDVPLFRGVISNAVLEGLAGFGMGAGVGANTAAKAKQEVAKVNQETKDILKEDLKAQGIEATNEQLDSMVENINKIREERKQNVEGEPNRVDTRTNQPSVPISEEQAGQGATTGVGETTVTDVGGAGQVLAGVGNREGNEPSALESKTVEELQEIKNNYEIEQKTNLYKNGNIPKEGTKRRQEYDALQARIDGVNALIEQKTTTEQTNLPGYQIGAITPVDFSKTNQITPLNFKDVGSPESQKIQDNVNTMAHTLFNPNNVRTDGRPGWDKPPKNVEPVIDAFYNGGRDARGEFFHPEDYKNKKQKQAYELGHKYASSLMTGTPIDVAKTNIAEEAAKLITPISNVTEAKTTEKTEEQLQAEEDAREEEFRSKAEADIDQQDVGLALARIENGDFEEKKQLRAFVNKLENNGTIEDASDIREALSDREQDVYDVLDLIREQLEEARDNAIEEHIDEQRSEYETNPPVEQTTEAVTPEKTTEEINEEDKIRKANKIPRIETLPKDMQQDPVVQNYHSLFDEWLAAKALDDVQGQREVLYKMQDLRIDLPEGHPAAMIFPKAKPKGKGKKEKVAPSDESDIDSPKLSEGSDILFKPIHPLADAAIRRGDLRGALEAIVKTGGQYLSNLASRFLSLDTNVVIGYDLQKTLVPKYLSTVKGQKDRIVQFIEIINPDIYNEHFNESLMLDPLVQMTESFNKLRNGDFDLNLKSFEQDLKDITTVYNGALRANNAAGFFYDNSVSFNSKFGNGVVTTQTFMHEVTHAFTQWAINNPNLLNEEQRKALDNLDKLYKYAKANTKNPELYGYRTLHEFVAEAFSSVKFQKELREMTAGAETAAKQSLWSRFIHTVYRILNTNAINKETGKPYGTTNVLFHTLANTDILFSAKKGEDTAGIDSPLMAPDKLNVKNGKIVTNTRETGFINALIGNRQKFSSLKKNNLSSFFSTLNDQYRRYLLGGLTLDQLTDIAGEALPQFKEYVRTIDAMLDTRNKILLEGEKSLKDWSHLLETNPEKAEELGTAMIEATFAKLDPDPKTVGYDESKFKHTKQGQRALEAWKKLESGKDADKAIAIYRDVRKFYETRMEEYIQLELGKLTEREQANNTPPEKITALVATRENELRKDIIKPYFPIKRFGDYWIQVGRGKDKIFMQFENAGARNVALQEAYDDLVKQGYTEEDILGESGLLDYGNQFKVELSGKLADYAQLSKLHDLINDTTAEVQSGNAVDKAESLRDKLNDNIDQLYLELMPSESIKKMFIHRKNIAGPSQDMLRAFAVSRQRVAYQRSRFQHLPQLFLILEAANKRLATMQFDERTKWRDYVRELELNLKTAVLEPPKQSRLTTFLTQFGFLHYLTAPASALVNAMAVPGIYIPAASPKYGMTNVTTSLAKYNRMLGGTGFTDERTGRWEFLSLARAELANVNFAGTEDNKVELPAGKTLADAYQAGVSRGVIDVTLSHDAAAIGEQPSDQYTGRWQKVMYYASLPFHAAEKYNRETTFMATFDMAYRKYIDKGYTKEKAYDAAVDDARDLVQSTMFNYNTINKPRYFRGDFRNIVLQFKMYPQHMTMLMFRTFEKGWAGGMEAELNKYKEQIKNSPDDVRNKLIAEKEAELKQLGKEARQQFMGTMGMTFLFAGASGLPLFFIFEGIANAFNAVFGDDEEPFDVNNWFKNWCNRTFGGFVGDSISRGLLSQATGLNFADRMSVNLNDMWFPDVKKSNDEVQNMQNRITSLLGPTTAALLNYGEALKRYNDGHTERAIEAIMPSAIKNVMVGTRYLVEGKALTLKGAELDSNVSSGEAVAQMLGFTPEKIAQKQKATFETKGVEQDILNRHTDLLNAFFIALDSSDTAMTEKVINKIAKFNAANPGNAIDFDTLYDSVIKRYEGRALANVTGGMSINKKLIPQLDHMLDYSRQ
jgi:hypothetical protein